jgi:hypothetical protein
MADPQKESERLEESFRKANDRFDELASAASLASAELLASIRSVAKLREESTQVSIELRGALDVTSSVKSVMGSLAKEALFAGGTLDDLSKQVKQSSIAYTDKKKDLEVLRNKLGEQATSVSGIIQLNKKEQEISTAKIDKLQKQIAQFDEAARQQDFLLELYQSEIDIHKRKLVSVEQDITLTETLAAEKTILIKQLQDQIIAAQQEIEAAESGLSIAGISDEKKQELLDAIEIYKDSLNSNNNSLTVEVNERNVAMQMLKEARDKQLSLTKQIADKELQKLRAEDNKEELVTDKLTAEKEIQITQSKSLTDKIKAYQDAMQKSSTTLNKVAGFLEKLVGPILELQKQFGIAAGSAAKLKFENLMSSVGSYMQSLMTGQPGVSMKEIEATQGAFQNEFGGVLTSEAATNIAEEAKQMGVNATELAKARRVFMTQTMGDVGDAQVQTDKFIAAFAEKGLTAKDAMEAIGKNSELLARAGTRFADSFVRAAADAKKIGVELSKVNQVGDNIIGNFEGFLESQAELGAMGFGFDSSRLAEIAESGDTGALFEELRGQLGSQGKDLGSLRRSEQLALSSAFGMSMEDFQRMAAPPGSEGSGEETLSPEELQKNANKSLGDLVFRADAIIKILGVIAGGITLLNSKSLISNVLTRGQGVRNVATTAMRAIRGIGSMGRVARIGVGAGVSAGGAMLGDVGERMKESGNLKSGGAVSTVGEIAKYAGIGMMFGPVGAAVGGLIGAVVGITKNFDAWKAMFSDIGSMVKDAFMGLVKGAMNLGELIWKYSPINIIGSILKSGFNKAKSLFGGGDSVAAQTADDMVSKPGYGDRALVTQDKVVALNNQDTVVAYADDMVSTEANITTLSKGALAPVIDASKSTGTMNTKNLEAKLDQVIAVVAQIAPAVASMNVHLDGTKVGKVLAENEGMAVMSGGLRAQRG